MKRALLAIAILVVLYAAGVAWSYYSVPEAKVSVHEAIPNGEGAATVRIVRAAVEAVDAEAEADGLHKRDAHAKPHGCVKATFKVAESDDIPLPFRKGVFIPTMTYKAWLRFSNGTQADDTKPDARGLGIKLMGVQADSRNSLNCWTPEGEKLSPSKQEECAENAQPKPISQDFNLINYPAFFLPDVMAYEEFFGYQVKHNPIAYFLSWNPLRWKSRGLVNAARNLSAKIGSPLEASYYTMTAFKLGPHNAKYAAMPCKPSETPIPEDAGPNFLRDALVAEISARGGCFDFKAQLQDPTSYMPVEDPTVQWDEGESPYVTLARIEIHRQDDLSTDAQNQFCEQISISPWHGTTAHRPIGGLNRVRRLVYDAVSTRRHARNGFVRHEPQGWCLRLDGESCDDPPSPNTEGGK